MFATRRTQFAAPSFGLRHRSPFRGRLCSIASGVPDPLSAAPTSETLHKCVHFQLSSRTIHCTSPFFIPRVFEPDHPGRSLNPQSARLGRRDRNCVHFQPPT